MLTIIDCGIGNTGSIVNMVRKVGGDAIITNSVAEIKEATAIILPGVGAFDHGMNKLNKSGLIPLLRDKVFSDKIPLLGICLGMQLMFDSSEEGCLPGLGWVSGDVKRFDFSTLKPETNFKLPHMGWNIVSPLSNQSFFGDKEEEQRFYFVHSYHVVCKKHSDVLATSAYGYNFTCAVKKENICGVQFHPEKSHQFGMNFFRNYLREIDHA